MSKHFCIRIHFLVNEFHGRGDHGQPEWPPSPLRLFQALVAAGARLGRQPVDALHWLERQQPPDIITPDRADIQPHGYTTYVPDNVGDLVAKSWSRGVYFNKKNKPVDIAGYRTEKFVRPIRLEDGASVHYLWSMADSANPPVSSLIPIVRAISQFGWGIDLVVADAAVISDEESSQITGERRLPSKSFGGQSLRVPVAGTLEDLKRRYDAFLDRVSFDSNLFKPVPPLSQFSVTTYRRAAEISRPPYAIFALRKPDDSGFAAFAPARRGLHLSGMLRHVASRSDFAVSLGWEKNKIASFVLGHGEAKGKETHRPVNDARLVFIPLPSIEYRGAVKGRTVGAIRRVLVTVKGQIDNTEFSRILRNLEGRELIDEKSKQAVAFLCRQTHSDSAIEKYFSKSNEWVSVTPVILPGYDDPGKLRQRLNTGALSSQEKARIIFKLERRIDFLLRKALRQDGYPEEHIRNAQLQWRGAGFIQGSDLARNYAVPDQHRRYRRLHVRILWRNQAGEPLKFSGPFCIGGGRFTGLGLFTSAL